MVEKILCSQCNEVSYTTTHNVHAPCPFCGYDINWKDERKGLSKGKKNRPFSELKRDGTIDVGKISEGIVYILQTSEVQNQQGEMK